MNKKQYITPQQLTVQMKTASMICLSGTLSTEEGNRITSSDGFGARSGSIWEDEEE